MNHYSSSSFWKKLFLLACFLVWGGAQRLAAGTPAEELLRLVPDDVGMCFLVQDLRPHAQALLRSEFGKKFLASPLGQSLAAAPEAKKILRFNEELEKHLQVTLPQLRDEILGDALVFAYWPGPPGKPEQEQGIFLLKAPNPKLLNGLFQRLNEFQKQSGELKELETRKHQGMEYFCRVENRAVHYLYLKEGLLAFTSQETLLRRIMERSAETPAVGPKRPWMTSPEGIATFWINPRAFDAELQAKADQIQGPEALILKTVASYWKALRSVAVSVSLQKQRAELKLNFTLNQEALPASARGLFTGNPKTPAFWNFVPEDCLFATAGTLDGTAFTQLLEDFLTEDARKGLRQALQRGPGAVLGRDVLKDVIPYLGPDWGLCVTGPTAADKDWFPAIVWALRIQPGDNKDKPLDRALLDVLNSFALFGVIAYNNGHQDQLTLKDDLQDKVQVKYLTNDKLFPPGMRPAFAFKEGYLLLASSPEAIKRFQPAKPSGTSSDRNEVPVMRASLGELARFIKDRRSALAAAISAQNKITEEEAGLRLDNLAMSLQLFDRLDLLQHFSTNQASLILRLRTAFPLD